MKPENLVTPERQRGTVREVVEAYSRMGIHVEVELKAVPAHRLIATQNAIEREKLEMVRRLMAEGKLDIPVVVEEHFVDDDWSRYLIDGHCRTRVKIMWGRHSIDAYCIYSPAGTFPSNFVTIAARYGNKLVKDLPLV